MTNRIAILISGEYRTFDQAVKFMNFLHHESVDVYFSTWDKTVQWNPMLDINTASPVTADRIKTALGTVKLSGYCIDSSDMFPVPYVYNSKMIYRWTRGYDLIRYSGKQYSGVFLIRPDLAIYNFDLSLHFPYINDDLKSLWYRPDISADLGYMSTQQTFDRLFKDNEILDDWVNFGYQPGDHDWHQWFYHYLRIKNFTVTEFFRRPETILVRPNTTNDDVTFADLEYRSQAWKLSWVEEHKRHHTTEEIVKIWGPGIFDELQTFKEGQFRPGSLASKHNSN